MASEIYKRDKETWRPISLIDYNDNGNIRSIQEVLYNDNGIWRQVFGASNASETLVWAASTPTGTLTSTDLSVATSRFSVDVLGAFSFSVSSGNTLGGTATPLSGTYRPQVLGADSVNYEININASSVTGSGVISGIGSTIINGTWQTLNLTKTVELFNATPGSGGSSNITVEIREIAVPSNTTGQATFTLSADGDGN